MKTKHHHKRVQSKEMREESGVDGVLKIKSPNHVPGSEAVEPDRQGPNIQGNEDHAVVVPEKDDTGQKMMSNNGGAAIGGGGGSNIKVKMNIKNFAILQKKEIR